MRLPSVPFPEAAGPSMAMIMLCQSSELCSELCHQLRKVGEAGCDHARIVDRHCLACAEAECEKGHGDAMIHVRRDQPSAFDLSSTHDNEILAFDARLDTACRKPCGGCPRALPPPAPWLGQ